MLCGFLVVGLVGPSALAAQEIATDIEDLDGFTVGFLEELDQPWVDPVELAALNPEDLEPIREMDPLDFHDSNVFAAGIDLVPVDGQDLQPLLDRHLRSLQALDTLDRDAEELARDITRLRPEIGAILTEIRDHETNVARLAREIDVLNAAIAEFAVRAFISDERIETVLGQLDTRAGEERIVSDEVRVDQLEQISRREDEIARREAARAELEVDLTNVRANLRELRRDRLDVLERRRLIEELPDQTETAYRVALHLRLPEFVEGTDIPLVALNAYVIAARTLEETQPNCGIEWWMLAGIGRIESFHGHFEPSTLDLNGHTTTDIRGPALDGRILSGAEFLEGGSAAPLATGRTEDFTVTPASATNGGAGSSDASVEGPALSAGAEGESPAEPAPVIRRLALIRDSDGGVLDSDPVFDRAVGPMQFIPQTWNLFEADGNLDEETDPQNIYDASLAAANYLCASTTTMTTLEGRQQAFFAYNHDEVYSANVEEAGQGYRELIELPDVDEERTEATLPLGIGDPERLSNRAQALDAAQMILATDLPGW